MTDLATTQLGDESLPVMHEQAYLSWDALSRVSSNVTGQGVDVIPTDDRSSAFQIESVSSPTSLTPGVTYWVHIPTAGLLEGSMCRAGIVNLNSTLVSTYVVASAEIKGCSGFFVASGQRPLSLYSSRFWNSPIDDRFELKDRDAVTEYLEQNGFLISLLMEAFEKIRLYFGSNTRLILKLVKESDSDQDEELFILIKTTLSAVEASRCLERLDEEWWLGASRSAQCKLNIDFEIA